LNFTHTLLVFFSLFVFLSKAPAQERDTLAIPLADSVASDTTVPLKPITSILHVGTLDRKLSSSKIISDSATHLSEYTNIGDIVTGYNGSFVRDLGSVGQYSELTLGGLGGRHITYLQDGILLNEPITGIYNPYWLQTEQVERVEIETGIRAFLYGLNSTGGVINALSKHYKAIRPQTLIRYSESRYEQTFFDGMFSQNLTRSLNLTGGVERYVTDGRFRNSDLDMWGARIRARYDISNRWNVYFSENYTQTKLGLYGGVNYDSTANTTGLFFDPRQATVVTTDVYEKITRHDLQLGVAAQLFDDSTNFTVLTAYYSTHFRELRDENNRQGADTFYIFDDHHSRLQGLKLTQNIDGAGYSLNLGGEVQTRQVLQSPATGYRAKVATSGYGKLEIQPLKPFHLAGFARLNNYLNRTALSWGADASLSPFSWIQLYTGYSQSSRFPTFQELYWRRRNISGPTQELENERHHLFEAGIRSETNSVFSFEAKFFRRTIHNHIVTISTGLPEPFVGVEFFIQDRSIYEGIDARAQLQFWHVAAEGHVNYLTIKHTIARSVTGSRSNTQPKWWALGGVYYRNKMLDDNLDLKVGFRGRAFGEQLGTELNPEAIVFVPSSLPSLGIGAVVDGVLIARIGSAYVHLIWQNLFDNEYVITPFYPMPDRAVRFGITWQLMD
jgi:outer membrane cobalamin receptor